MKNVFRLDKGGRVVLVFTHRSEEEYEFEEFEERSPIYVDSISIALYEGFKVKALIHSTSNKVNLRIYSSLFRKTVKKYLSGEAGIDDILRIFDLSRRSVNIYRRVKIPKPVLEEAFDKGAILVKEGNFIAVAEVDGYAYYYRASMERLSPIALPGIPPKRVSREYMVDEVFDVHECFPGEGCDPKYTEVYPIVRMYPYTALKIYTEYSRGRYNKFRDLVRSHGIFEPDLSDLEEEYSIALKLSELMEKAGISEWRRLLVATAFAYLLRENIDETYAILLGEYREPSY